MAITAKSNDSAGAAIDAQIVVLAANVAAAAGKSTQQVVQQALTQAQTEAVRHYLGTGQIHPAQALAAAGPVELLTGVVITSTSGAFSCTKPGRPIVVGQLLTLAGTYGGTGSITGYANPTTYAISVTNGSTTGTLTTAAGAAIVTTTGTPTGITYSLTTPLLASDLPSTTAGNAQYGAQGSNLSARITALTTAAAGSGQYTASAAMAAQALKDAQTELLFELVKAGVTTPATILANLS
jgi:hypothetical protein